MDEYRDNQVKKLMMKRRKKKRIKVIRLFFVLGIIGFVFFILLSDIMKIKTIHVIGVNDAELEQQISEQPSGYMGDYTWIDMLFSKDNIVQDIEEMKRFENVLVEIDFMGNIQVHVQEVQPLCYAKIQNKNYLINKLGGVYQTKQIPSSLIQCSDFQSTEMLSQLGHSLHNVSDIVLNETSKIHYCGDRYDKDLIEFYMYDHNFIKINISQIDQRLSEDSFHYAAYKLKKPQNTIYSFEGKYMYIKNMKNKI